jgi:MFS family permease
MSDIEAVQHEKPAAPVHDTTAPLEKDERYVEVEHADIGAKWLHTYEGDRPEITEAQSANVRNRIDMFLIPVVVMIYFTQQLDKSSLSFASVFDLISAANLVGTEYSWLGSIVYFAQLIFQPLSVYALVRFPVNYWICFCFLGWGASCCIMAAFTSFPGLLVFRFILGAFEASIAPSMLIIVAMWWTRREQPLRNNIWYSANGIATILGSLMTWGLGHAAANTVLYQYQLIFLACGVIAVFLCIPTFFILPGHPVTAKWLTPEQKYIALERIRLNNTGTQTTEFKWAQVREAFTDPKSYGWMLMIFCISLVSGGIG